MLYYIIRAEICLIVIFEENFYNMFDKLSFIQQRFNELETKISDPEIIANQEVWRALCKEHSDIAPIVEKYSAYNALQENIEEA